MELDNNMIIRFEGDSTLWLLTPFHVARGQYDMGYTWYAVEVVQDGDEFVENRIKTRHVDSIDDRHKAIVVGAVKHTGRWKYDRVKTSEIEKTLLEKAKAAAREKLTKAERQALGLED